MVKLIFLKTSCNHMTTLLKTLSCGLLHTEWSQNSPQRQFDAILVLLLYHDLSPFLYYLFQPNWTWQCAQKICYVPISIFAKFCPSCKFYLKSFFLHEEMSNFLWLNMTLLHSESLRNLPCDSFIVPTLSFFSSIPWQDQDHFWLISMWPQAEQSARCLADIHLLSTCWLQTD